MQIAIISVDKNVCKTIYKQLFDLIGNQVPMTTHIYGESFYWINGNVLVLFTGQLIYNKVIKDYPNITRYIIANRVIDYQQCIPLISLKKAQDVLLVNDYRETCEECIKQFNAVGIDYLNLIPYYPGYELNKYPKIAITPGQSRLVPNFIEETIDVGIRKLDIISIYEVLKDLGILVEESKLLSSWISRDIFDSLKKTVEEQNKNEHLRNRFRSIFNASKDGMIYIDSNNNILEVNDEMIKILDNDDIQAVGKNVNHILDYKIIDSKGKIIGQINYNGHLYNIEKEELISYSGSEDRLLIFKDLKKIKDLGYNAINENNKIYIKYTLKDFITRDDDLIKTFNFLSHCSKTDEPILISGETGVGKEIIAQSIHSLSSRVDKPFIPINFSSISPNLYESELFGYEKGAFTGANKEGKIGLFEEANDGTLFLDEVGDAPLPLQSRILRVLQEGYIRRVGGTKLIPLDVRVIAATNKDLMNMIKENEFREDLYYRLSVIPIYIKPLRKRKSDIILQINHYLSNLIKYRNIDIEDILDGEITRKIISYEWPGNTRQLVNFCKYLSIQLNYDKKIHLNDIHMYLNGIKNNMDSNRYISLNSWLSEKLKYDNNLGRRRLYDMAKLEGYGFTENQIRKELKEIRG